MNQEQNNNNENSGSLSSLLSKLKRKFLSIPMPLRGIFMTGTSYFLVIISILMLVAIIFCAPAGLAQELFDALVEAKNAVVTFFDRAGNFFTGDGFVTDQEAAEKAEKAYYEHLEDLYEHFNSPPYNVQIDITMITSTLFYGRTLGDYNNEALEEDVNSENLDMENIDYDASKKFYKQAKKMSLLLAAAQIVVQHTTNSCVSDPSQVEYSSDFVSAKEFAKKGINAKVNVVNKVLYNYDSAIPCPYEDATSYLKSAYDSDKNNYEQAKSSMNNCMATNGGSTSACSGALTTLNNYRDNFNRWSSEGLFDENGNFSCSSSSSFGSFSSTDSGGCVQKSPETYTYSIDIAEEGVYYYRLITVMEGQSKSFIENYYYDEEGVDEELLYDTVDGIYSLYRAISEEQQYCYTSSSLTGSLASSSNTEFIGKVANEAVSSMASSGVPASISIAQAILESSRGHSRLSAPPYYNFFGMTAGSCAGSRLSTSTTTFRKANTDGNSCTGNSYWNGDVVWMCRGDGTDCQWYRAYDGFSNSLNDHNRLISQEYSCSGNYNSVLDCIVGHGYATDSNYKQGVLDVINGSDLTQYDIAEVIVSNGETTETTYVSTICYSSPGSNSGYGIIGGEGTLTNGTLQGIRTSLNRSDPTVRNFWYNNNLFYQSRHSLENQCTWYANGRALEILTSNGMSLTTAKQYLSSMHGNAQDWYSQNRHFSSSTNVNNIKVGAIIVWKNVTNIYGHVGIVEDIKRDEYGNVISVSISEGGTSINGFRFSNNRSLSYISSHGNYRFIGYVYLLD